MPKRITAMKGLIKVLSLLKVTRTFKGLIAQMCAPHAHFISEAHFISLRPREVQLAQSHTAITVAEPRLELKPS